MEEMNGHRREIVKIYIRDPINRFFETVHYFLLNCEFFFLQFYINFFVFMSDIFFIDLLLLSIFNFIFLRNRQCKFFFSNNLSAIQTIFVMITESSISSKINSISKKNSRKRKQKNCSQNLSYSVQVSGENKKIQKSTKRSCFSYKGLKFRTFS